jgi:hypothetical protein
MALVFPIPESAHILYSQYWWKFMNIVACLIQPVLLCVFEA